MQDRKVIPPRPLGRQYFNCDVINPHMLPLHQVVSDEIVSDEIVSDDDFEEDSLFAKKTNKCFNLNKDSNPM